MPYWIFLSFQDSSSPTMEQLNMFHDHSIILISLLTILTLYLVITPVFTKTFNKFTIESQELELFWTIAPAMILLFIAIPSIKVLYLMEETKSPMNTIKVVGHQWYWSYEVRGKDYLMFDRFIESSLTHRLLKNREVLLIEALSPARFLVSSEDVIHSWTVPSLGIKVDALPGRLNQLLVTPRVMGIYFGQCSEICGVNHSFMPISLMVVDRKFLS
jgi:cytochrome c oxidase subunit 2